MKSQVRTRAIALAAALAALAAPPAAAQYFGQNKVQYDNFDWQVLGTEHLDVHFYGDPGDAIVQVSRSAERWAWRLSRAFQHELSGRKPVVMYASHPDFQQTNIVEGRIGVGTGGVTDALRNRATQPFTGDFASTDHVVGHELAHVYQYDIAAAGAGVSAMARLPLWLVEGMAEYLSVGRVDPHTAMWMRDAVLRDDVPTIADLSTGEYFPYRYGQAVLAYVGGRWGDVAVTQLYRLGLELGFEEAVRRVTGMTSGELSEAWAASLRDTYAPVLAQRQAPSDVGRPLLADDAGRMQLAPGLSPDGSWVAFISERGVFSMDLWVADARTGEVVRRLTSSQRAPHFDALNFIETAGTWSPDGSRFAYVVVDEGDTELRITEVRGGGGEQSVEIDGLETFNDPAWSPDGRRIAFSGTNVGGFSDLYLYDLETGVATRLTDDLHAELQPSWSPDGRSLVFVTDRGPETSVPALAFGPMRLARLDLESGRLELLPSFAGAKHIDPHYAPDGQSLYFVSDRGGVSDVFRLELPTGRFFRVTATATGVSGITAHSPALTVAERTGTLAFSIFTDDRYLLRTLSAAEAVGEPVSGDGGVAPAGVLPPVRQLEGRSLVSAYLGAPGEGLPSSERFTLSEYDAGLGLEYIGSPSVGASLGAGGTQLGGAVAAHFTDLLGNRRLGVAVQAQGELQDLGGTVFYENRESRLNWGAFAGRIPQRSGRRAVDRVTVDGQEALRVQDQILRMYLDQAGAQVSYPFSTSHRLEATGAYTRYSFGAEARQFFCDPTGRQCGSTERVELDAFGRESLNLFQVGAAYVGDWANFGFTGPVVGGRFRFELQPTFGDLAFLTALADYRRYFLEGPVTLALRGLHVARYGDDAENREFLAPLFLGEGDLVRGYTSGSFRAEECSGMNGGSGCPEFERLIGSRVAVAGAELRLPLLGTEQFGLISFPVLPTTVGAFFDAGVAWTRDESPLLELATDTAERVPVASAGAFARVNLLGYLVVSGWAARPFQRPDRGWVFGIELGPGW